jgi:hypothetical protein
MSKGDIHLTGEKSPRIKEEHFFGSMVLVTGVLFFKKVWGLPVYRPILHTWIENRRGQYVGDEDFGRYLYKKGIIDPETMPAPEGHDPYRVCSIGWCESEQKWYGWSHRAMYGFGIGNVVEEGDCTTSSGWTEECLKDHPSWDRSLPVGFTAKTIDDCKLMAIAFAESVG